MDEAVLVTVCGGHTVRLLFPYAAGEPELREVWSALGRAIRATE
jgi:4-aminobutyrate aminotransferase-like enzyme